MKLLTTLALTLALATPAFATSRATLVCTSGTIGEDNFVKLELLNGAVDFQLHETSFVATAANTKLSGNTVAILNQTLKGAAEGDEFTAVVNALLVYDPAAKTLNATLIMDKAPVLPSRILKCK